MKLTDAEMEDIFEAAPSVVEDTRGWEWHVLYRRVALIAEARAAKAWEEGRCAAARGQKNNPYIDKPSKDGED